MADLGSIATVTTQASILEHQADFAAKLAPMSNSRPGRLRVNFIKGKTSVSVVALDIALQAPIFAAIPPIQASSGQYLPLTINPSGDLLNPLTAPEIVWVYSHILGSTTVLVHRGKENTTAKAWASGTDVINALTAADAVLGV